MDNENTKKNGHGGARQGAGRKTKHESTKVMRVPVKYEEAIKALIRHLDDTATINHHYDAVESTAVYLRSIDDKKQNISFKTTPVAP